MLARSAGASNSTTLSAPTDDLKTIRPRDLGVRDLQTAPGGADLVQRIVRSLVRTFQQTLFVSRELRNRGTRSPESPPVGSATLWQPTPSALPVTRRRQSTISFLPLLVPRLPTVTRSTLPRSSVPFEPPVENDTLFGRLSSAKLFATVIPVIASIEVDACVYFSRGSARDRPKETVAKRLQSGCDGHTTAELIHGGTKGSSSRRCCTRENGIPGDGGGEKKWCVARSWHARKRQNKAAKWRSGPGA